MRAIFLEAGQFRLEENHPTPEPGEDEVLLRVRLAAVCGTDLELARGYYSFSGIPGHEFVGEIAEGASKGQRVVADINIGCGQCEACLRGNAHHCRARSVLGIKHRAGAFAEFVVVPKNNLVPVRSSISDEAAALAEPVAAALRVLEPFGDQLPEKALVIGAGRLGFLVAQVLQRQGIEVTVYIRNDARRSQLANAGLPSCDSIDDAAWPWIIETSGAEGGLALAERAIAPQGTITLKSTIASATALDLQALMVNEVRLLGSRCGDLVAAEAWLGAGHLRPPTSIRFGLHEIERAIEAARSANWQKIFIDPSRT